MPASAYPALYCLAVWWFSTGLIVFLNNLPPRSFRWSFGASTALAIIAFYRLVQVGHDTSVVGAYAAFTYAVLVWGWHEMAFFMGFVTGPRRTACPAGVTGWRHFCAGVTACIDHELAILATGVGVLWASWSAPNHVGLWTFSALWGMRLSAKLNVSLGVLNLGDAFLPDHLAYLLSFMSRRRMNWLMPVSLAGGMLLLAWLVRHALVDGGDAADRTGLIFLITMVALGVLEHAMLVVPLPFEAVWYWWLAHRRGAHRATGRSSMKMHEAGNVMMKLAKGCTP